MNATAQQGLVQGALEGDPRRHMGHLFDWKAVGRSTGGAFALIEIEGWRGGEPPIHYHTREDELFYVLDGEATFKVGEELRSIGPGGFVWAPRNVPHGFAFTTERVRMLVGLLPAGQEEVFFRFSEPDPERRPAAKPDPAALPDLAELEAADNATGVVYVGPPLAELLGGASGQ
jgi:quercetin dioxygenase-like cupin family protein